MLEEQETSIQNPETNQNPKTIPEEIRFQYEHFYQGDDKFQELREKFPNFQGICWFACFVMATQALNPEKSQQDVMQGLNKISFDLRKGDTARILAEMRKNGKDTNNFWKKGQLEFISLETGGLKSSLMTHYSNDFANLVSSLFEDIGIDLELKAIPDIEAKDSVSQMPGKLRQLIRQGNVPILTAVITDEVKKEIIAGHLIMIGGANKDELIVSDPESKEPTNIKDSNFIRYIRRGFHLGKNNKMYYDPRGGFFVLRKIEK